LLLPFTAFSPFLNLNGCRYSRLLTFALKARASEAAAI
jgi:hypothetical protein